MPQVKETTVYTFDELNDKAKEKARDWWLQSYDCRDAFDIAKDDAQVIGLIIDYLDDHMANKGHFASGSVDCAKAVLENHGPDCETYKTAKSFLLSMASLNIEYPEDAEGERSEDYKDEEEELENDFKKSLLEDYRIMFNREVEYQQSNEVVDENIRINDYTFTADGKRF